MLPRAERARYSTFARKNRPTLQPCGRTFATYAPALCDPIPHVRNVPPQRDLEAAVQDSEVIRRRNLPHWDVPTAAYFVTTCLEGSIPARGLLDLESFRTKLAKRPRPSEQSEGQWRETQWKLRFARMDSWLDRAEAARYLEDERLAQIVADALCFFAGERYYLLGFVVMPSHFHWVFQPLPTWVSSLKPAKQVLTMRQRIVHSINRFTASACNQVLGRSGGFWQREAYDHWVRSPEELERILSYVENNPVRAGFVESPPEWRYSSAWIRRQVGLELGQPLPRRYSKPIE
jgi:type I restriction enzyme R subunit